MGKVRAWIIAGLLAWFTLSPCRPVTLSPLPAQTTDDPLPLRRVVLPPERVAAELERAGRGALVPLPRDRFEELVRRAAAGVARQPPPRLVEARYRATLADQALVGGADWKVHHLGPAPGLLSLEPLQLALRRAVWPDNRPADLGDLDPRAAAPGLELLVERPGGRSLTLDWSARGLPEPGRLRF